jgi:hypothetical protein
MLLSHFSDGRILLNAPLDNNIFSTVTVPVNTPFVAIARKQSGQFSLFVNNSPVVTGASTGAFVDRPINIFNDLAGSAGARTGTMFCAFALPAAATDSEVQIMLRALRVISGLEAA